MTDETVSANRRRLMVARAVLNELAGAGVLSGKVINRKDPDDWHVTDLPLDGRLIWTGSKNPARITELWRWVRDHRQRKKWGALASPAWGVGAGIEIRIPLEDFATLLGKLDMLLREQERWLNGPASGDVPGKPDR